MGGELVSLVTGCSVADSATPITRTCRSRQPEVSDINMPAQFIYSRELWAMADSPFAPKLPGDWVSGLALNRFGSGTWGLRDAADGDPGYVDVSTFNMHPKKNGA